MSMDGGVALDGLSIDGGAAANNLLCQMQADALQLPVDRSAELQTTGLGAAFLAGLGIGMWPSFDSLASTRHSSGIFHPGTPDPGARARWRSAVERSKGWAT
jgi:glycerol kinase